jgi:hypothetical protein
MSVSRFNSRLALMAGTAALALLSAAPAFALSPGDPTPIGLPEGQAPDSTTPPAATGATTGTGGVQSAPLPPLPAPAPEPTISQPAPPPAEPGATQPGVLQPPAGATPAATAPAATTPDATTGAEPGAPGLLDDTNNGLGASIWQGSSSARLIGLVPRLPAPQTQPSLRDLQLRLLLTKAPGPNAAGGLDTLVPLRAERLHAMGFSTEALLLTQAAGNAAPADAKGGFEKALADNDVAGACAKADEAINAQQMLDLYWRKALLFCQLDRGQEDQARIGLDLLREMPDKDQATKDFVATAAVMLGEGSKKKLKLKAEPDAVQAAMMRKLDLPVKPQEASAPKLAGPAEAAAIARDASQPLDLRIERGEYAFGIGLITADELINLYKQTKFTGDPLTLPDTPASRGQLYQAADQAFDPVRRAQFVQRALATSWPRGAYFTTAALYRPIADKITPAPNLAWFAPDAARMMFATGNSDKASFWLNLAQGNQANAQIARAVAGLQILAQIAGVTGSYPPDSVAVWQQATTANPASVDRLRGIQAGLGLPGVEAVSFPAPSGDAAIMSEAAQAGRRGETTLLALILLGGKGLGGADGATLAQSLGGLNAVALNAEAKRIALEAAILAGL